MTANSYYGGFCVREICHAVKSENPAVRQEAVDEIAGWYIRTGEIGEGDVLVPVPQHGGRAVYTLSICRAVAGQCGCTIADMLRAVPHESLYGQKLHGRKSLYTGLYAVGRIAGKRIFLIDNVLATGKTMHDCMMLVPEAVPFPYAIVK